MPDHPDILVLAGGGVLGEAWMQGVLAGYEDASGHDFRSSRGMVGTSAGSIVSASIAAGGRPRRPGDRSAVTAQQGDEREAPIRERSATRQLARMAGLATAPFASMALVAGAPAGAALRGAVLSRVPGGFDALGGLRRQVEGWRARWDGRLRITAVDRANGRRVVFGAPGAPSATVAEAVQASCSIPGVFRPVRIGGREYVDGGAWSITNLDAAPARRGDRVLCLVPTMGLDLPLSSPFGIMNALSSAVTTLERATLRQRGVRVKIVGPASDPAQYMARGLMSGRHARDVHAGGYRQGLELGSR